MKNKIKNKEVWMVVTIVHGDPDMYGDIIGVYTSKKKATSIFLLASEKSPIKGLDYNVLGEFDDIALLSMPLNETVKNDEVLQDIRRNK